MPRNVAGEWSVKAKEFNKLYPVGSGFDYQPLHYRMGGRLVRTVDLARDMKSCTVVEINREPYFANIKSLKPTNW